MSEQVRMIKTIGLKRFKKVFIYNNARQVGLFSLVLPSHISWFQLARQIGFPSGDLTDWSVWWRKSSAPQWWLLGKWEKCVIFLQGGTFEFKWLRTGP